MLVLVNNIEKICEFEGAYHIVVGLKLINCDKLEEQAKQLEVDLEEYSKDCFVAEFDYSKEDNKLYWLYDDICYVDINGENQEIESYQIIRNNVYRTVCLLVSQFLKDKEKYAEENHFLYEKI